MNNKNIVLCFDGTWNHPASEVAEKDTYTNVWKLYCAAIAKEGVQVKWYDKGVGVEGLFHRKLIEGATGKGLEENIIDGYLKLLDEYHPGDNIFLFGFSRGATTARALASLIYYCGIVQKEKWENNPDNKGIKWNDKEKIARKTLDVYLNSNRTFITSDGRKVHRGRTKSRITSSYRSANSFKINRNAPGIIKMLGVWDTVSALTTRNKRYKEKLDELLDMKIYPVVQYACHAVSIDEVRGDFELVNFQKASAKRAAQTQEVWFAGAHSNVGGGFVGSGLSDIALEWMLSEAVKQGLKINTNKLRLHPDPLGEMQHPEKKLIYTLRRKKARKIPTGSMIHSSVHNRLERIEEFYEDFLDDKGNNTKYNGEQTCYKPAPSHKIIETDPALAELFISQTGSREKLS